MSTVTTHEILFNLQEMFGDRDKSIKKPTLKIIVNTKMTKRTLIRDNMVCIFAFFNDMEILGVKIN